MKLKYILIILLLNSCSNPKTQEVTNSIAIIIENPPTPKDFVFPSGLKIPSVNHYLLSYLNESDSSIVHYQANASVDTLSMQSLQPTKEVLLFYKGIATYYTLLQQGDTVRITFNDKGFPTLSSRNPNLNDVYNFTLSIKDSRGFLDLEPLTLLPYMAFFERTIKSPNTPPRVREKYENGYIPTDSINELFNAYLQNYQSSLDLLSKKDDISPEYTSYYDYLLKVKKWQYYLISLSVQLSSTFDVSINSFLCDDYLKYPSYHTFCGSYLRIFLSKKHNIQAIEETNGTREDWERLFDVTAIESNIPLLTKNTMLKHCFEEIVKNGNPTSIKRYEILYTEFTNDFSGSQQIKNQYQADITTKDQLILQDINGMQTNLESILASHKGKVIYVDFWASWCAPCKQSMPYAKKLREEYRNKDIIFIYLGYNDETTEWKSAVEKYELNQMAESYLVLNPKAAKFAIENNIKTIPRYMLFSKRGELINNDAPRPETDSIRELLDAYLAM